MESKIRENCVFCKNKLNKDFFSDDLNNYVAHYSVGLEDNSEAQNIPFNVCVCDYCKTPQLKYLGDLNEIYKLNHADSTGKIMNSLHQENLSLILKYKDSIKNIIEIGSSKGVLADEIIKNIDLTYYIVEPSYFGETNKNKIIIPDFYENIDDSTIDANTMVISHVFEHFYEPMDILNKISKNKNIENFFLVFPDLEYYINNNVLHVLNTEHTFYIDNHFLIKLLTLFGFELIEKRNHENHSVLFYFKRTTTDIDIKVLNFENTNYNLEMYYSNIKKTVEKFNIAIEENKGKEIYLWPASIHSLYLINFGLNVTDITGFLDNSKIKIGGKMYGTELPVFDFNSKTESKDDNVVVLVSGGVFNKEVENQLNNIKRI